MQRVKQIGIDNVTYEIGALSVGQTTAFLKEQRSALGLDEKNHKVGEPSTEALEQLWRNFLIVGLNNALKARPGDTPPLWTSARVVDEIDLVAFAQLRSELLVFSGLESGEKRTAVGEVAAAS